jgi:hypothetical protein
MRSRFVLTVVSRTIPFALSLLIVGSSLAAAPPEPLKVFILAGQSNMEGQAVADLSGDDYNDGRGTLKVLLDDPAKARLMGHLRGADGKWTVRDDVSCRYVREGAPLLAGRLTMGFSVYGDVHHFGPELQFGHVVGDHFDEPVLLIKTAWGGKSLHVDFRPPSAGGTVGPYYTKMIAEAREALGNLDKDFPEHKDREHRLAGFIWYHGWNDGVDPQNAVPAYEQNLVHLIRDIRKEFDAPNLPVVIGELTGPWVEAPEEWALLRKAQAAAAARPEFRGSVRFVETHDFVRKPEDSPNPSHGHHEFGNAETYFLVGDALGRAAVALLSENDSAALGTKSVDPDHPVAHTARDIEGWIVRVDDRLLAPENDALRTRALRFLENELFEIRVVVPENRLKKLQSVPIVLDLTHGQLGPMQYHPSADWLEDHGYSRELAKCVHLPRAADLATRRNISEQPWVILHELAHAYHDRELGFDEPRIKEAWKQFEASGRGEKTLLYDGSRVRHYALTTPMEFFAEMTEAFFGVNDFYPFNRAELKEAEPEIHSLLNEIWTATPGE